jgi:perosamine synthetase
MPSPDGVVPHSHPTIEADDLASVDQVLRSGHLAQGNVVRAFEDDMAALLGLPDGVATSSGTAALHLALLALGVGPGAEVLIPSYTCVALLHAVHLTGATPRIVDSEPDGVNMWAADAARQVSPITGAIILPHMFGTVGPLEALRTLGVPIIENCAQALGATTHGVPAGSLGDVTVLSFYATKVITTGEGGMLLSRSEGLLADAQDLRDYDNRAEYRLRFNYKMTDVQAALGRSQLSKLSRFVSRRQAIADAYHAALDGVAPAYTVGRAGDMYYRYVIRVPDPDAFIRSASMQGVECKRPVFRPLHELLQVQSCPHAARTFRHAVSLPLYPSLSDDGARTISRLASRIAGEQLANTEDPGYVLGSPVVGRPG